MQEFEHETHILVDGEEVPVWILYSVDGDYRPATWGYHGGDPEEFPEIEIVQVTRQDTMSNIPQHLVFGPGEDRLDYERWHQEMMDKWFDDQEPDDPDYDRLYSSARYY